MKFKVGDKVKSDRTKWNGGVGEIKRVYEYYDVLFPEEVGFVYDVLFSGGRLRMCSLRELELLCSKCGGRRMSKEKARLEAIKERVLNATPGPWLERIDEDYYQGGLYLGVSPYHYCRHPDNPNGKDGDGRPWGKHSGLDEDGKTEYFNEDICRIESENEGDVEFLKHAVEDMRWLLSMLGGLDEV